MAAIVAEGIDQEGGRVHLRECNPMPWPAVGCWSRGSTIRLVQAIAQEGTGLDTWNRKWDGQEKSIPRSPYPALRVIGGPLAKAGKRVPGVIVQGGDTGRWDVRDGGKLIGGDCWYERNWAPFHMFLRGNGRLTLDCFYDAQYTHPTLKGVGVSYAFENWRGRFASISVGGEYTADNPVLSFGDDCRGGEVLFLARRQPAGRVPRGPGMAPLYRHQSPHRHGFPAQPGGRAGRESPRSAVRCPHRPRPTANAHTRRRHRSAHAADLDLERRGRPASRREVGKADLTNCDVPRVSYRGNE